MAVGVKAPRNKVEASTKGPYSSPPARKMCKASVKEADWADVTDPEERRRIQNRIAQRKFREKARENREKAERESRNHEHAGNSYRIPLAGPDMGSHPFGHEAELSGLPWGGMNLSLVVSRGHEAESRRSSGRGTYTGDEPLTAAASPQYGVVPIPVPVPVQVPAGGAVYANYSPPQNHAHDEQFTRSGCGERDCFFDDASYVYDAMAAFPLPG